MQLEFSYELVDLRESRVPEKFAANPEKYARRWIPVVVIWAIAATMGAFDVLLKKLSPAPPRVSPDVIYNFRAEFLPALLPALYVYTLYFLMIRSTRRTAQNRKSASAVMRGRVTRVIYFLVCIALGVVAGMAIVGDWGSSWRATPVQVVLITVAPWLLLIVLMQMLGFLLRRAKVVGEWRSNAAWGRPKLVKMDETGFLLRDQLYQINCAWPFFARARETKNLLILESEARAELLIPKRAFAHPADLDRCRSLLQNVISQTDFLVRPIGFEVLPKPVLPLPPIDPQDVDSTVGRTDQEPIRHST